MKTSEDRIKAALEIAMQWGGVDGADHKAWVIDQMVRALTGCPIVEHTGRDYAGTPYTYKAQGESSEYGAFVATYNDGDEGPDTFEWPIGVVP